MPTAVALASVRAVASVDGAAGVKAAGRAGRDRGAADVTGSNQPLVVAAAQTLSSLGPRLPEPVEWTKGAVAQEALVVHVAQPSGVVLPLTAGHVTRAGRHDRTRAQAPKASTP